jgi:hypothetical protein
LRPGSGEGESTMKILGKQSLPAAADLHCRARIPLSGRFPGRLREISGNTRDNRAKCSKFMDTRLLRISG